MAILQQLGVNQTFFMQLVVFLVGYLALHLFAFNKYTKAMFERQKHTTGGQFEAIELIKVTQDLNAVYELQAKKMNTEIKNIFDDFRATATKEHQTIIGKARAESQKLVEEARAKVVIEIAEATRKLKEEVPNVALAINSKILAKK